MKKKVLKRVCSTAMGALMFVCLPMSAFAREIDVTSQTGWLSIDLANETEDLILTGINTNGGVELIAVSGTDKTVILRNLSLDNSGIDFWEEYGAALSVVGTGNIIIELDGTNILKSSIGLAGFQKQNDGTLTIKDDKGTSGSLEAIGGFKGAGIGGGGGASGSNIIIEGGTITAIGGDWGAGIGGREDGTGDVTITGGNIIAVGGYNGAGIGGGEFKTGDVTITGGNIIAVGSYSGAGIGGGTYSNGSSITISNDAIVYAAGGAGYLDLGTGKGAAIGEGGTNSDPDDPYNGVPVNGIEVLDISGLYDTGSVTVFAAGTTVEEIKANPGNGVTVRSTVPDPPTQQTTTEQTPTKELPQETDPVKADPNRETPKNVQPPKEEPPAYTERSCIADVNVAALIAAALKADPNAKEINIEFDDNICLTPDIMKDLFADNRVAKNCMFSHEGKRYVLRINAVDTTSATYADCFEVLKKEPGGLAGFKRMAQIFEILNVTLKELDQ